MPTRSLSIEDRKLDTGAKITASSDRFYSDIDLSFKKKRNGDIFKKTDANAVKQAVKNLILTNHYEKPFSPFFGGNIRDMLFELGDQFLDFEIKQKIKQAIRNYEPRAEVLNISTNYRDYANSLDVSITFLILSTNETITLETEISRLR